MQEGTTQQEYHGAHDVIPIPLGKRGEAMFGSRYDHGIAHIDSLFEYSYRIIAGGEWGSITIPSVHHNPLWTPESDVNNLPQSTDESDRDYANRLLANKDKQELCIVEYEKIDNVLNFYCDSVEWDGNYANMDRTGDGSPNNPWRNVQHALSAIYCHFFATIDRGDRWFRVSCPPTICLRVKGIINYPICRYDIHPLFDGITTADFDGHNLFILTSWDNKTSFEIRVTHKDNKLRTAVALSHCVIANCSILITVITPSPETNYFPAVRGIGQSQDRINTTNRLYWNCHVEFRGNSPKQEINHFYDADVVVGCSAKATGSFRAITVTTGKYNVGMNVDLDVSNTDISGVLAEYVYNAYLQIKVDNFVYAGRTLGIRSKYCSNARVYILLNADSIQDVKVVASNVSSNCVADFSATVTKSLNLTMITYHSDYDYYYYGYYVAYNCYAKTDIDAINCKDPMTIYGIVDIAGIINFVIRDQRGFITQCSSNIKLIGGGRVVSIGLTAGTIVDSYADVQINTLYGYAYALGCQALKIIDSIINVSAINDNKSPYNVDDYESWRANALCTPMPNIYQSYYAHNYSVLRCELTAFARSNQIIHVQPPRDPTLYWHGSCAVNAAYHYREGSSASAFGCVNAIQSKVSVESIGMASATSIAVLYTAIDAILLAKATSTYRIAIARGIEKNAMQSCPGTSATAVASVINWEDYVETQSRPFGHTGTRYVRYRVFVILTGVPVGYAMYTSETIESTLNTCYSPITGTTEQWEKWINHCHQKLC